MYNVCLAPKPFMKPTKVGESSVDVPTPPAPTLRPRHDPSAPNALVLPRPTNSQLVRTASTSRTIRYITRTFVPTRAVTTTSARVLHLSRYTHCVVDCSGLRTRRATSPCSTWSSIPTYRSTCGRISATASSSSTSALWE